jgi:type IV secretory pathway protease TraF
MKVRMEASSWMDGRYYGLAAAASLLTGVVSIFTGVV